MQRRWQLCGRSLQNKQLDSPERAAKVIYEAVNFCFQVLQFTLEIFSSIDFKLKTNFN